METVKGTVIGTHYQLYAFFCDGKRLHKKRFLYFVEIDEAIDWAKTTWQNLYQEKGIEICQYDI